MTNDTCKTKKLTNITVQENGIVRNSEGYLIARLVYGIGFGSEHLISKEVKMKKDNKESGFYDLDEKEICKHLEHRPPSHLYIPPGKGYKHVCPGCGRVIHLKGSNITF